MDDATRGERREVHMSSAHSEAQNILDMKHICKGSSETPEPAQYQRRKSWPQKPRPDNDLPANANATEYATVHATTPATASLPTRPQQSEQPAE